jgi:hypothetical protein
MPRVGTNSRGKDPLHGYGRAFFLGACLLACSFLMSPSIRAAESRGELLKRVDQSIKQADLLVVATEQSVKADELEDAQSHLKEYRKTIETASAEAKEYRQNYRSTPSQFKNAEIRVRKQARRLQDIRKSLPIPLREDMDAAVDAATRLRKQFIGELFNVESRPNAKK